MATRERAIPFGGGAALNFEIVGGEPYYKTIPYERDVTSVQAGLHLVIEDAPNRYIFKNGGTATLYLNIPMRTNVGRMVLTFTPSPESTSIIGPLSSFRVVGVLDGTSSAISGEQLKINGLTEYQTEIDLSNIDFTSYDNIQLQVVGANTSFILEAVLYENTESHPVPNPKENTIWVSTDTPVNGYVFSAETPIEYKGQTSLPNGLIWVKIGTSSPVSFKIVNGLDIFTYPILVNQFIDGKWEVKTARTYLDGEWVNWETWFFKDGDQCVDITGGWNILTYGSNRGDTITMDSGNLTLSGDVYSTAHSVVQTNSMVDVTNLTSIDFIIPSWDWTNPGSVGVYAFTYTFGLATAQQNADTPNFSANGVVKSIVRKRADTTKGAQVVSLDVSDLQGKYYLFMDFYNYYIIYSCTISSIKGVTAEANTINL